MQTKIAMIILETWLQCEARINEEKCTSEMEKKCYKKCYCWSKSELERAVSFSIDILRKKIESEKK